MAQSTGRFGISLHQRQEQVFAKKVSQVELTVETQILYEQTEQLIQSFWDFLGALERGSEQERVFMNKKVVALCNAFGLSCEGFYEDDDLNQQAIALASGLLIEFDGRLRDGRFDGVRHFVEPMLNYAKKAIKGEETENLPSLVKGPRRAWNEATANETLGRFRQGHHVVSNLQDRVRDEVDAFKQEHQKKFASYGGAIPDVGPTRAINVNSMYAAVATNPQFGPSYSKKQMDDSAAMEPASFANMMYGECGGSHAHGRYDGHGGYPNEDVRMRDGSN